MLASKIDFNFKNIFLSSPPLGHHQNGGGGGEDDDKGWSNVDGGGGDRGFGKWKVDGGWSYETQIASNWVLRSVIRAWYCWLKSSCCW